MTSHQVTVTLSTTQEQSTGCSSPAGRQNAARPSSMSSSANHAATTTPTNVNREGQRPALPAARTRRPAARAARRRPGQAPARSPTSRCPGSSSEHRPRHHGGRIGRPEQRHREEAQPDGQRQQRRPRHPLVEIDSQATRRQTSAPWQTRRIAATKYAVVSTTPSPARAMNTRYVVCGSSGLGEYAASIVSISPQNPARPGRPRLASAVRPEDTGQMRRAAVEPAADLGERSCRRRGPSTPPTRKNSRPVIAPCATLAKFAAAAPCGVRVEIASTTKPMCPMLEYAISRLRSVWARQASDP